MRSFTTLLVLLLITSLGVRGREPPAHALWNPQRSVAIAATPGDGGTQITAYLRQQNGTFLTVDLSAVEKGNFGKLGFGRDHYDRFETQPIRWLPREDGLFQIEIRTRAWKKGRRQSVSEPLLFRADGTVLWR